ncbi:hypothetical protein P1O00_09090 [Erysipelothrix rhusiopathiae]|nr:hypothetical protein [Erysipelothrix rhusiopathiae]
MAKKRLNVMVEEEIIKSLDAVAEDYGLSRSSYIAMLINKELKKEVKSKQNNENK